MKFYQKNAENRTTPELSVALVPMPDFSLLAFSAIVDVLRHAADDEDRNRQIRCRWQVLSQDRRPVRSSSGLEIKPWRRLDASLDMFDYVVVVGGWTPPEKLFSAATVDFLHRAHGGGQRKLVGMCTASFAMAQAGLMDGVRTCIHWAYHHDFVSQYPKAIPEIDKLFVEDGDFLTSGGGTAASDLALHLVEKHLGRKTAAKAASNLLMSGVRTADETPSAFIGDLPKCDDARVRKAVFVMQQNISEPLTTCQIAGDLGVSDRQLARLFRLHTKKSPAAYYRNIRLEHTRSTLERTSKSVEQIAQDGGFTDASHFCRAFRECYSISPARYRAQHRAGVE